MNYLFVLLCLVGSVAIGFAAFSLFRVGHYKYIKLKRSNAGAKRLKKLRYVVPASFIGILSLPVLLYIVNFRNSVLAPTASEWGQFGDYVGGLLNPIFGFSSLLALLYTIRIQSQELRLTRLEFEKSVKAQEQMVNEEQNNRRQSLLIQDYLYVSSTVRTLCRELNSMLAKDLDFKAPPDVGLSLIPYGLGGILGMSHASIKAGASNEEYTFLRQPSATKINIESQLGSAENQSKFETACYDYCLLAHDLFAHARMLSDLCTKLSIDVVNEHTQRNDFKLIARHLFNAYFFTKIGDQGNFVPDFFIPRFDAVMMEHFEQKELAFGLKSAGHYDKTT